MKINLREVNRDFFGGLIKLHIIYHALNADISEQEIAQKLSENGYKLDLASVRAILCELEESRYIEINKRSIDHAIRDFYRATRKGKGLLRLSNRRIRELFRGIVLGPELI